MLPSELGSVFHSFRLWKYICVGRTQPNSLKSYSVSNSCRLLLEQQKVNPFFLIEVISPLGSVGFVCSNRRKILTIATHCPATDSLSLSDHSFVLTQAED